MDNGLLASKVSQNWDEYDEIAFIIDYEDLEGVQELYDLMSPYIDDDLRAKFQFYMEDKS